eukprot:PRCOL_00003996-RA
MPVAQRFQIALALAALSGALFVASTPRARLPPWLVKWAIACARACSRTRAWQACARVCKRAAVPLRALAKRALSGVAADLKALDVDTHAAKGESKAGDQASPAQAGKGGAAAQAAELSVAADELEKVVVAIASTRKTLDARAHARKDAKAHAQGQPHDSKGAAAQQEAEAAAAQPGGEDKSGGDGAGSNVDRSEPPFGGEDGKDGTSAEDTDASKGKDGPGRARGAAADGTFFTDVRD